MKSTTPISGASWRDSMPGGQADAKNPDDFDAMELSRGVRSELEHTHSRKLATEIAMDHLTEDPKYYVKLEKMEKTGGIKVPKAFKLKKAKLEPVDVPKARGKKTLGEKVVDRAKKFMKRRGQ